MVTLAALGEIDHLRGLTQRQLQDLRQAIRTVALSSSSRETETWVAAVEPSLSGLLTLAVHEELASEFEDLSDEIFSATESLRGVALWSARLMRATGGSIEAAELQQRARAASARIAQLATGSTGFANLGAAVRRRDSVERELLGLIASAGRGALAEGRPSVEALASSLQAGEALVAYRRYTRAPLSRSELGRETTDHLLAFVLGRAGSLAIVSLGPIEPIEVAVDRWRDAIMAPVDRGVGVKGGQEASDLERKAGMELRRMVLDPLLLRLRGAERITIVLDDVLHSVPLDALPDPEDGHALLGEGRRILFRPTLWELLLPDPRGQSAGDFVAFGGIEYDLEPRGDEASPVGLQGAPVDTIPRASTLGGFDPLTESLSEVRKIAALFEKTAGEEAQPRVLEARNASRDALLRFAPRARYLHLATHGYFAPESIPSYGRRELGKGIPHLQSQGGRLGAVQGLSPMVLCGLALAGANLEPDELGLVSGTITGEELAKLDLGQCELATLSACDTHVGVRRTGQGLASLQKALHMAGARSVITSLWKVRDAATRELMVDFYRRLWVQEKPKEQALWEAKMALRARRDPQGRPIYSTRDWAGWVLTGDPF